MRTKALALLLALLLNAASASGAAITQQAFGALGVKQHDCNIEPFPNSTAQFTCGRTHLGVEFLLLWDMTISVLHNPSVKALSAWELDGNDWHRAYTVNERYYAISYHSDGTVVTLTYPE